MNPIQMKSTGIQQTVKLLAKQEYRRQALRSIAVLLKMECGRSVFFLALITIELNV